MKCYKASILNNYNTLNIIFGHYTEKNLEIISKILSYIGIWHLLENEKSIMLVGVLPGVKLITLIRTLEND